MSPIAINIVKINLKMVWQLLQWIGYGLVILWLYINVKKVQSKSNKLKVAFLHPFCNDGGGGEKVLWFIVKALVDNLKDIEIIIYSLQPNKDEILEKAKKRFNVDLTQSKNFGMLGQSTIQIVPVSGKFLLQPLPFLTMVFQIVLPMLYALRCLMKYQPDIFYDTTGFAFSFVAVKIFSPRTKCYAYVHYPFISVDMIEKIRNRRFDFNNSVLIAKYPILTQLKIKYYEIILAFYRTLKYFVDFAHTNSSWTQGHIEELWGSRLGDNLKKLYPPCNVQPLVKVDKTINGRPIIMSFAQFRPEKNQKMQVDVYRQVCQRIQEKGVKVKPLFYMVGSLRGADDQRILRGIEQKVRQNGLQEDISFHVSKPFPQIIKIFNGASYGMHTMQAQHFGITCVEMLAAGIILVAHNSAGPKVDIIKQTVNEKERCGYLAITEEDYVKCLTEAICLKQQERKRIVQNARKRAMEFSDEKFMENFVNDFEATRKDK